MFFIFLKMISSLLSEHVTRHHLLGGVKPTPLLSADTRTSEDIIKPEEYHKGSIFLFNYQFQ